ncbi:hypothetical protein GCM10011405_30460 [Rufibacter glacialis]|nr:hypothetical protein GCM10011405_30460 [Rufibacter glacialis]
MYFLLGLAALLLNDLVLKGLYGNWLTGKLSDFAGLFVFPLFWCALFPKYRLQAVLLTGLVFIWWKSPHSQPFIDLWNSHVPLQIGRVVDFSDLMALAVLPAAFLYSKQPLKASGIRVNPLFPLALSAFAFMATSRVSSVEVNKVYVLDMEKATLGQRLNLLDSLHGGDGVRMMGDIPEMVYLKIPSDLCFDRIDAAVRVDELPDGKTLLTLESISHSCPEGDEDEAKGIRDFEKAVIGKLKGKTP